MHNNESNNSAAPEITWRRSPVAWTAAATMCREVEAEYEVKQCSLMAAAEYQKQQKDELGNALRAQAQGRGATAATLLTKKVQKVMNCKHVAAKSRINSGICSQPTKTKTNVHMLHLRMRSGRLAPTLREHSQPL